MLDVRHTSNPGRLALLLGGGSVACLAILAAHSAARGTLAFNGLPKNLALAWLPLLLSFALLAAYQRGRSGAVLASIVALWLLFLPNAPYLVTDFVHVGANGWSWTLADAALVAAFALTGLALALTSLSVVHGILQRILGRTLGWLAGLLAIALSGVGVYLGRVHRFNSWDALGDPLAPAAVLGQRLIDPLAHGRFYVALIGYTLGTALLYVVVYRGRALIGPRS